MVTSTQFVLVTLILLGMNIFLFYKLYKLQSVALHNAQIILGIIDLLQSINDMQRRTITILKNVNAEGAAFESVLSELLKQVDEVDEHLT